MRSRRSSRTGFFSPGIAPILAVAVTYVLWIAPRSPGDASRRFTLPAPSTPDRTLNDPCRSPATPGHIGPYVGDQHGGARCAGVPLLASSAWSWLAGPDSVDGPGPHARASDRRRPCPQGRTSRVQPHPGATDASPAFVCERMSAVSRSHRSTVMSKRTLAVFLLMLASGFTGCDGAHPTGPSAPPAPQTEQAPRPTVNGRDTYAVADVILSVWSTRRRRWGGCRSKVSVSSPILSCVPDARRRDRFTWILQLRACVGLPVLMGAVGGGRNHVDLCGERRLRGSGRATSLHFWPPP